MRRTVSPCTFLSALLLAFALVGAGCDPGPTVAPGRDAGGGPDGASSAGDADGDTISDADEGADTERDSDGDGVPDYMDDDSDGDGIPDSQEAGDDNVDTPPFDSDDDGMPDFIDDDADGNGIPDSDETDGDVDGDGTPNFQDLDDDNDLINDLTELDGQYDPPIDTDGDGVPDYQDRDSDDDMILDGHERNADTDMDGVPDVHDLDSDDDGLTDEMEAGDDDLETNPVDSDMDGVPDFRDLDSDNDGLTDSAEVTEHGTSPTEGDSDGDGVSDLIEVGADTDPTDGMDSPRTRGNFVFTVPYEEPPDPTEDTLQFRTSIQFADVYFLFDISGSMGSEIGALRSAVGTIMGNLTCMDTGTPCMRDSECSGGNVCSPFSGTCIEDPGMSSCVASVYTGAGYYEDHYWHSADTSADSDASFDGIRLQPDPAMTSAAMATWDTFGGTEELYQALWGVADPSAPNALGCETLAAGEVGCPAYRGEAVKILVAFTDEDSDGSESVTQAATALMDAGITMIGVWSGSAGSSSRNDLRNAVIQSDSFRADGTTPLFYEGADASVVPEVTTAINEIVEGVPLRVTIEAADEPDDDGDSLQFIEALETNTTDPGCSMIMTEDSDGDGIHETYPVVTPGTPVCWDVIPRMNTTVMPAETPQVFIARLTVRGDGSPLDSRLVYFLVPPEIPDIPGGPD